MADFTNRTFDEIAIGASTSASRTLTSNDVEALALAAGDVDGYHVESRPDTNPDRLCAQGAATVALVAGLINRRLPGPGSAIRSTALTYAGKVYVGDTLTASVTAKAKHPDTGLVDFECRCVNQDGLVLVDGIASVRAPTAHLEYTDLATPEIVLRHNDGFAKLLRACEGLEPVRCAVVHPCDRESLRGAVEAARRNLIVPVLVGPEAKIRAVAAAEKIDISPFTLVPTEHSNAAAARAVAMVHAGTVEALMKGSLHTDELMAEVVAADGGLRTGRRISHVFVIDVPTYPRLLMVTDAAVNIAPDLASKVDICQNAIDLAHVLGVERPKVAILSAVETVNPKLQGTVDAAALCKMADRGQITGRRARRSARVRQRGVARGGAHQEHRVARRRRGRHPRGAGPRGRQHAGEAAAIPRWRGCGRHRARRTGADRAHVARRQSALAPRLDRGAEARRPCTAQPDRRGRLRRRCATTPSSYSTPDPPASSSRSSA